MSSFSNRRDCLHSVGVWTGGLLTVAGPAPL